MNNEAIVTKRNVLVVDDDPAIQEMLCEIIQQEGCNAVSVKGVMQLVLGVERMPSNRWKASIST